MLPTEPQHITSSYAEAFARSASLLGPSLMQRLATVRVVLFGVGGVGSWCAEGLIRTGLQHLTIVDCDCVDVTNINRQLMATASTVGQPKVEVLRRRLLDINPGAHITALHRRYEGEPLVGDLAADIVVDAIDSLDCKLALISEATRTEGVMLVSSMGAAMKTDPTRVQVAEFWKVSGCPLARALRTRIKKNKEYPQRKFQCVYSDEPPRQDAGGLKGSIVQVTAVFGFTLCSLVVNSLKPSLQQVK